MQPSRNVTHGNRRGEEDLSRGHEPGPRQNNGRDTSTHPTEDVPGPPAEKKRVGNVLLVNERNSRTPSPLLGAAYGDDDSEAESFRNGRSDEVDRDTRTRAFLWCRDFLSGSWKTLQEADFQISIVR